jgi:beta-aspartyl-dipeptidase (metallo-type)
MSSAIVIENGEVHAPEPIGRTSLLILGHQLAHIGACDDIRLPIPIERIDASGCLVVPGLIDPHEHLTGGSGERGFRSQTPEITLSEIVSAGITTVVGCLGVDATTKTMQALVAKARGLNEEGLTAYAWAGGYDATPLFRSMREDILFLPEVIGAGEIALSDHRSSQPSIEAFARLVKEAHIAGMLGDKAGVTHFHMGDEASRLEPVRRLLDDYAIEPNWVYPTHVERNEPLMRQAIELTRRGVTVDIDVVEEDLAQWLKLFVESNGDLSKLTISSDASITSPATLFRQLRSCILDHGFDLEMVLRLATSNTADVLKLTRKGRLCPDGDADVLILRKDTLEIRDVVARGRRMMADGKIAVREDFLEGSNRRISLIGSKAKETGPQTAS